MILSTSISKIVYVCRDTHAHRPIGRGKRPCGARAPSICPKFELEQKSVVTFELQQKIAYVNCRIETVFCKRIATGNCIYIELAQESVQYTYILIEMKVQALVQILTMFKTVRTVLCGTFIVGDSIPNCHRKLYTANWHKKVYSTLFDRYKSAITRANWKYVIYRGCRIVQDSYCRRRCKIVCVDILILGWQNV